ncbi:hypothetical protein HQ533_05985 [Candidatus Woesearchaeota archaeon]|nr:hypothetical protein [Candidatus Woesearchaeota archaeon]
MKRISLILLLLIIPFATALEVTELEFLEFESHGKPLTTVSMGRVPNIDLKMVITGSDFKWLSTDLSGLNRNDALVQQLGYENKAMQASSCEKENDTYTCYIRKIILLLPGDTVIIPITLHNDTDSVLIEEAYTFDIDNTEPNATYIGTETCLNTTCFIASDISSKIRIDFRDEKATFDKKIVRYELAGKKRFVHECEGLTCYGFAKVTCNSGQRIPVSIRPLETMDDAYNKVANNLRNDLLCDSDAPEVLNVTVGSEDEEYVKIGDTLVVIVNVTENLGEVSIEGNFSEFGGEIETGACSENDDGTWVCTVSSPVIGDGPYTGSAELYVKDTAGNMVIDTFEKEVWGLNETVELDEWTVGTVQGMPAVLNTDVIRHTTSDVKIYYKIPLSPKVGDVEILEIRPESCVSKQNKSVLNENDFKLFNAFRGTTTPLIVGEVAARKYDPGIYEYECIIKIRSKKGRYYHTNYEVENISFSIVLKEGGNAKDKIIEEANKLLSDSWLFGERMDTFIEVGNLIKQSCGYTRGFTGAVEGFNKAYNEIKVGVDAKPGPTSEVIKETNQVTGDANTHWLQVAGKNYCDIASCDKDSPLGGIGEKYKDLMCSKFSPDALVSLTKDACRNQLSSDKSLIVASLSLCVPDIALHLRNLRGIETSYLDCLLEGVPAGVPISTCQQTRGFQKCRFITGEALNAFPFTNMLKDFTAGVHTTLRDPLAMAGLAATLVCRVPQIRSSALLHAPCLYLAKAAHLAAISRQALKPLQSLYEQAKMNTYTNGALQNARSRVDALKNNE